jgi:hypothetical protein
MIKNSIIKGYMTKNIDHWIKSWAKASMLQRHCPKG